MKKLLLFFLITETDLLIFNKKILAADFNLQHILETSNYNHQLIQPHNAKYLPLVISADYAKGNYPDDITFIGNVNIRQGDNYLRADKIQFSQKKIGNKIDLVQTVDAIGNVHYYNNQIILNGLKGWINLNTRDIKIWNGNYQIIDNYSRGKADLIKQYGKNSHITFKNGSLTFCPLNSEIWNILGSKIIYNYKEQIAKVWNAQFRLKSIPIFYIPYLQLPTGNERRSGFLTPKFTYSTSKYFEFHLPYYWNIAPNVDATFIIPCYICKDSNMTWKNEFRYLTYAGNGIIELDYLPSNKLFKNRYLLRNNHHCWLFYWKHNGMLDNKWHFDIDYAKTSDPYYLEYFNSKNLSNREKYAIQKFSASYKIDNFIATISTKQFQIFDKKFSKSYFTKPQLDINWHTNNIGPLSINIYAQAVHFTNINSNMPESIRLHLEPNINLSSVSDLAKVNIKLMATHYQQKIFGWYNTIYDTNRKNSINRLIPQLKMDGKLVFERNTNQTKDYTQILEAHIQYLYVPYRNQSKIQNCDSSIILPDHNSLFYDCLYIGLDRISSIRQLKTSFIAHVYDSSAVERLNISVGQIYCFDKTYTGDDISRLERPNNKIGISSLIGNAYWHMTNYYGLRSSLCYDINLNKILTSNSAIEYFRNEDRIIQLTYRSVNPEYINTILPIEYISNKTYKKGISQIGSVASWPISSHWSVVGAHYFSINTNKLINQMVSLQYNSCCYTFRITYEHKLNTNNTNNNQFKYNKMINFNIELHGSSSSSNYNTQQIMRSNLFPYHSLL